MALISPARKEAYRILLRIEKTSDFAIELLQAERVSQLRPADRNLTVQLVMGVLRWRGDLDFQIEKLSAKPVDYFDSEILQILRLGVFQIRFLSRIPKPAAVYECVELAKAARKKSAAALVNAVLRKCEPAPWVRSSRADADFGRDYLESATRSIPPWIRDRWVKSFGAETATAIVLASQEIPRTYLRVNSPEGDWESVQAELRENQVQTRPGTFGSGALEIESGDIFSTKAWREGRVVIQEEASQLVAALVQPQRGQTILDLCAAPGIKTGQLAVRLRDGVLVACDRSLRRIRLMEKLLPARMPDGVRLYPAVLDASRPLPFGTQFDRVLADVPCSGTGTLARNPEVKWRLRPEDLTRLAETQLQILRQALTQVAPRGRVVYSTCSLEPEENEQVVASALAEESRFRLISRDELQREFPAMVTLFDEHGYFRTCPGIQPVDGFFAAVATRES